MYLKSDRDLYRQRRQVPWVRLLLFIGLIGAGGYVLYSIYSSGERPILAVNTPTPMPTATPSPAIYIAEAEDAYWAGKAGAAITAYQQALDIEPNQADLYLALARLLVLQGRPERGLEMAREALRRQPENARAWALLGMAYDWLGMSDEAIDACEKARELDPTLPEAYAYLAEAYIDSGNWFDANTTIATAMELDETNVDVLRDYAYVLESQGNYYGAIAAYRDALEIHPHLAHLYLAIGRNANALGNLSLAQEAFANAVDADPGNAVALDRLGWTYLLTGEYDKARTQLNKAVKLDPTFSDAYGHLATLSFQERNYEDAIETFKPAVRYGEARSRRRVVFFVMTAESVNAIGDEPAGSEIARAAFVHPHEFESPLRGIFQGSQEGSQVQGRVRLEVTSGRYLVELTGLPPAPTGKVYVGWLLPLLSPERKLVHTDAIFPAPDGRVEFAGDTGPVKGPPIETYYTLALSYYFLDECREALPYIQIALRIDPEDASALQTLSLCQQ